MRNLGWKYQNKVFESRLDAQWSAFLTALGIVHYYKITEFKTDSEQVRPTFTLPSYHGGVYLMVTDIAPFIPSQEILSKFDKPLWVVVGEPQAKASHLYSMGEMGEIIVERVIPAFSSATDEHKLFTNPRAIDRMGRIPNVTLQKHGAALINAIAFSIKAKIDEIPLSQENAYVNTTSAPMFPSRVREVYEALVDPNKSAQKEEEPKSRVSKIVTAQIETESGNISFHRSEKGVLIVAGLDDETGFVEIELSLKEFREMIKEVIA